MTVELITAATPEIHEAMGRLIPQLSRSAAPMSEADVQRFLSQDSVHLFAFRPDEADAQGNRPILGMLSLVTFEIPTGVRAWIEDVVVDEAARGHGAGVAPLGAARRPPPSRVLLSQASARQPLASRALLIRAPSKILSTTVWTTSPLR